MWTDGEGQNGYKGIQLKAIGEEEERWWQRGLGSGWWSWRFKNMAMNFMWGIREVSLKPFAFLTVMRSFFFLLIHRIYLSIYCGWLLFLFFFVICPTYFLLVYFCLWILFIIIFFNWEFVLHSFICQFIPLWDFCVSQCFYDNIYLGFKKSTWSLFWGFNLYFLNG